MNDARRAVAVLDRLRRFLATFPIARAALWTATRTSQRAAVTAVLVVGNLVGLITGGNRSGKTESGAMLAVAFALGRDHPAVVAWAQVNRLDVSRIQRGPGVVCCSALTGNDSRRVQREKVAAYLPAGTEWTNRSGAGEATARLPGGGVIIFKSNDQGRRAFQGAAWHFLWMDEEHDEPVFNEARMRLADHGGLAVFTMTPLKGRTWVWRRFSERTHEDYEPGAADYALNSRDNPHVPQDYLDRLLSNYGAHERAAREQGSFVALEGRVFGDFARSIHVIPSRPIPSSWTRYQGWDFGTRNPACVLWAALDPADDVLHVYREHYRAGWTTRQHAEHVIEVETCSACRGEPERSADDALVQASPGGWESVHPDGVFGFGGDELRCVACVEHSGRTEPEPEWRVADPAAKGDRKTLARHHDIRTIPADNAVRSGLNDVAERLALDVEGRPHLVIHDSCRNTIAEAEGYVWDTTRRKGNDADAPLKRNDHAMDVLRYMCRQLSRRSGGGLGATA